MAQTLEESVLRILQSPEAARVKFDLLGVEVNVREYRRIADKILEGTITVELDESVGRVGAAAQYSAERNVFRMGSHRFGAREWQSMVVHEATHAIVDVNKISITKIDDEVVAHVAHTLYLRRVGFSFKSHGFTNKTWFVARDVADSILRNGSPSQKLVEKLQETVRNDPLYHDFIGETAFVDG